MPGDRLEKGLAALVDTFGRDLPKDKHAEALQRARSLLKEHQGDEHTEDYGQLADLIKKRCKSRLHFMTILSLKTTSLARAQQP